MREEVHRLRSEHLSNERTIWLRLPGGSEKPGLAFVFLDAELYRDRVGVVAILDELEKWGAIPRCAYAFVSSVNADARWIECPCNPAFVRFVGDELVPWLERIHPGLFAVSERVLAGLSYTGLAAAFVALEAPSLFTKIVAQSGSFWWNEGYLIDQYRRRPRVSAEFFLDVGCEETDENVQHREDVLQVISQIEGVRRFRDVLVQHGCRPEYQEFDDGHTCEGWARSLPRALRWALPTF